MFNFWKKSAVIENLDEQKKIFVKEAEQFHKAVLHFCDARAEFTNARLAEIELREKELEAEKEKLLTNDSLELKRKILMPKMQAKWEAEAKRLDLERARVLETSPAIYKSLAKRIEELERLVAHIQSKEKNCTNNDYLITTQARLDELQKLVAIIDKERNEKADLPPTT